MNRGPRVGGVKDPEETSTTSPPLAVLSTGDTFVFFVNSITFSGSGATPLMPSDTDWIPAFSVVELLIAPRHIDSALMGRILNVKCLRPSTTHIDSFFQSGIENVGLPFTAEEGSRRATERRELYPALSKDLEVEKTAFLVKGGILTHAYMGEIPVAEIDNGSQTDMALLANPQEYVKVCVGNMPSLSQCDYIDIKMDLIKTQTNTLSVEHGCAFLDVAFALGAVNLVVFFDPRWSNRGSCYRAIPVIDTNILFAVLKNVRSIQDGFAIVASVVNGVPLKDEMGEEITTRIALEKEAGDDDDDDDEDAEQTANILSLKTDARFDDGFLALKIKVTAEDTYTSRDYKERAPNSSLSIIGLGIGSSKAYPFAFDVVCTDPGDNIPGVVQAFMNRGLAVAGGISRKRKAVKMCL
jgi:hypothetical protein